MPTTLSELHTLTAPPCDALALRCQPGERLSWQAAMVLCQVQRLHISGCDQALAQALALLAGRREWRYEGGTSPARAPLALRPGAAPGHWIVEMAADADWIGWMRDEGSNRWAAALICEQLHINLAQVTHLRSVIIGWMLSLRQMLGDQKIDLMHIDRRALAVLQQMRLGAVITIDGREPGFGSSGSRVSRRIES